MLCSETMSYFNILFSKENSWEVLEQMGNLGIFNFEDQHKKDLENQKPYFKQISEINDLMQMLSKIQDSLIEW